MFPNGSLAHIRVSWLDPNKTRRITVVGNKKMVVYDDVESLEKIKIYDKGVDVPPYTDSYGDFQCSYRYGDVLIPNIRFVEPLRLECQHFIDCILQGTEPQSSGRVGMNVVRVLEAADRSLQNGGAEHTVSLSESQLVPANGDENGKGAL
jgi:predicted dehydrogenase